LPPHAAAAYRDVRNDGPAPPESVAHLSAYCSLSHWERAGGEGAQLGKTHIVDETFGVNSAFNAKLFVAPPHAVAMEFDMFGERRSSHWVKGGGVSKRKLLVG